MLLQFKIPKKGKSHENLKILAGDVGATKTNLALYQSQGVGVEIKLLAEEKFITSDYNNISEIINKFIKEKDKPDKICLGVAGPVMNGRARLSNIAWEIDSKKLSADLKVRKVNVINDLEANAYGLALLSEADTIVIHAGDKAASGNAAIIAPGTGLGEAGIFWNGKHYLPFATEGGHCDFAPRTLFDFDLYIFLQKQFGHVSWERIISGPGIVNIYKFLHDEKNIPEETWLSEKIIRGDAAAVISSHTDASELCNETMHHFIRYLAYESANLVLKHKAIGGLFIGGGIAPQITSWITADNFYNSFCQSGRLNYLLEKVPVKIILNTKAALLGAAWYGAHI